MPKTTHTLNQHLVPNACRELWRREKVQAVTGLKKGQLYQLIREGRFIAPVKLADRSSAWPSDEVQAWVDARIAERDTEAASRDKVA